MLQFKTLKLRNFLGYGNAITEIDLDQSGKAILIRGLNKDNSSQGNSANGVGKTSILNGLVFCLFGKTIKSIAVNNIINNINKKNLYVEVTFNKGNDQYKIIRYRNLKDNKRFKDAGVCIEKNGKDITAASAKENEALIVEELGMTFEMFVRIVVFSATYTPFLSLPSKSVSGVSQSSIIENLFGLTLLSEKAKVLKEEIKTTKQDILIEENNHRHLFAEVERYKKNITDTKSQIADWDQEKEVRVQRLMEKKGRIATYEFDIESRSNYEDAIRSTSLNVRELESKEAQLRTTINQLNREIQNLAGEMESLADLKCPYCRQAYVESAGKLTEVETAIVTKYEQLSSIQVEYDEIYQKLLPTARANLKSLQDNLPHKEFKTIADIIAVQKQQETIDSEIEFAKKERNPFVETLAHLQNMEMPVVDTTLMDQLRILLEHQEFLLNLLTKNDSYIRKRLIDNNIGFLNSRLQHYLSAIGLPHKVLFNNDLSNTITLKGVSISYENLSSGEEARVNFALNLTFRDILRRTYGSVNFCMCDEVLDVGLDTLGVSLASKLIKHLASEENTTFFVISHKDEVISVFDETMLIVKENGFSRIEKE